MHCPASLPHSITNEAKLLKNLDRIIKQNSKAFGTIFRFLENYLKLINTISSTCKTNILINIMYWNKFNQNIYQHYFVE